MPARRPLRACLLLVALAAVSAGCGPSVDVKQALHLTDTSSGWYDAGIVEGKNKIVPSVSFKLRKSDGADVSRVALNVSFRKPSAPGSDDEVVEEVFIQRADFRDANETDVLTIRPKVGYTADPPQSRMDILKHSQFRDVRAHVFARLTSSQWVELGTIDVERQLITR